MVLGPRHGTPAVSPCDGGSFKQRAGCATATSHLPVFAAGRPYQRGGATRAVCYAPRVGSEGFVPHAATLSTAGRRCSPVMTEPAPCQVKKERQAKAVAKILSLVNLRAFCRPGCSFVFSLCFVTSASHSVHDAGPILNRRVRMRGLAAK